MYRRKIFASVIQEIPGKLEYISYELTQVAYLLLRKITNVLPQKHMTSNEAVRILQLWKERLPKGIPRVHERLQQRHPRKGPSWGELVSR